MSDIPPELFPDILSRVPVESLLRFRCVCKAWCRIIDDPTFVKSHLQHQTDDGHLLLRNERGTKLYTLSLDSFHHFIDSRTKMIEARPLKTLIRRGVSRLPRLPAPQCNGLFLIFKYDRCDWTLWNPFTSEYHQLPSYKTVTDKTGGFLCVGLGYDSVSDDFKVVKIGCYKELDRGETLVYSLKSDSWKIVMDCPCRVPWMGDPGVFVNGALHWISETYNVTTREERGVIVAFDLVTEDYRLLPLPSTLSRQAKKLNLDVLNGCLVISYFFSIYLLDDYGGENKWTRLFSFRPMESGTIRPVAFLKSKGEILLKHHLNWDPTEYFFLFDIEKKSIKKARISGAKDLPYSQMCHASLVRLNKSGGVDENNGSKAPVAKKRKWTSVGNSRLKLALKIRDVLVNN